jgi:hypothetical protein
MESFGNNDEVDEEVRSGCEYKIPNWYKNGTGGDDVCRWRKAVGVD